MSRHARASWCASRAKNSSKIRFRSRSCSSTTAVRSHTFTIRLLLTDSRKRIAHQHVHNPAAAVEGSHQNRTRGLLSHVADEHSMLAARGSVQRSERSVGAFG